MNEKELKIISDSEIAQNSVSSLPTRPNAPTSMGGAGLSSPALRARFDALAMLAINKINAILKSLNGEEDATPFAKYIQTTLENGEGGTYTLYDVLEWLQSNDFAEKIILSEDGEYTLAQFYNDFNAWLSGEDFAKKIILVEVPNGENYTLAQFFQDFNITPSFGTLVGVEHWGNENVDLIHGDGISYTSKIRFNFQDFCYPTSKEFQNDTLIPIVAGDHIEFSPDDRGKVVGISAIVEQSFNENSTEAQSGIAVSGAIQPLSDSIATIQNKISSLEAQVDLYPLFTFHSNLNMEAIVSGYTDTISFNRVVDGKTEEVFNKEPSVGDIFFAYGQSADSVRFHMTAVITAIDNTDNPSQATFKALEVYEDAGEGAIAIDPNYDPKSLNAQSGKAVREAVAGVQEQIPLVLPYTFEWGDTEKVAVGADNTAYAEHFNRTPKDGDIFFINLYETHTDKYYHVSAEIQGFTDDTEDKVLFKLIEVFEYPSVDQEYSPESDNAQSGKAVAQAIANIPVGGGTSVPDYVLAEAEEVADKVLAKRNADSFVMALASDLHTNGSDKSSVSVLHAGQGMDAIASMTQLDLVALLGDYEVYYFDDGEVNDSKEPADSPEDARKSLKYVKKVFSKVAQGVPFIQLQGNHDKITTGYEGDMAQICYAYIGANNVGTVTDYENKHRIYGYRDFENYKIRVIYLNTTDVTDNTSLEYNVSQAQLTWLKDVALNLTDTDWGIIVLTHHPLNWYGMTNLLNVLDEYKGQGSGAKLIAHFHGHIHNFRVEALGTNGVVSITIPNACFDRENEYGTHPNYQNKPEIIANYGDTASDGSQRKFEKEEGTSKDTTFNVVVVDRKGEKIHCINYGAGIDRIVYFDGTVWEEGDEPEVPPVTPDEPETPGTPSYHNIIDDVGYKNDTRLSTSSGNETTGVGLCTTGLIDARSLFKNGASEIVIRTKGIDFSTKQGAQAAFVAYKIEDDGSLTPYSRQTISSLDNQDYASVTLDGEGNMVFTLNSKLVAVFKICGYGDGANLIVTINEPIE